MIEIKVPTLPESVSDASIAGWHKQPGDFVKQDESLLDLETDKVVIEVPAPAAGKLGAILKQVGDVVTAGEVLGQLIAGESEAAPVDKTEVKVEQPFVAPSATELAGPSARREAGVQGTALASVQGTGKSGRITREDVVQHSNTTAPSPSAMPPTPVNTLREERVPMSRLRERIAKRLLASQQQAAMLTTFNEVNLQAVMDIRRKYKDAFEKQYGVRLGFMSFFVKAVIEALKQYPAVNASIEGSDIIKHHFYDIGIAVSTDRGVVVPVLRSADQLGFADIEKTILGYAKKARDGQISLDELMGGTFTITNGGVFGSLLSTPIINPPQSGILAMHKIEERPVVEKGQIVIRPMMYIALSYDHCIIDGKESVGFLVAIKNMLEDPARLLINI